MLAEGYIYPKAERPVRDLSRRRGRLVRQRTANLLSVQNMFARQTGRTPDANRIKKLEGGELDGLVGDATVALACAANLAVMGVLDQQIAMLEKAVLARVRLRPEFGGLLTVPGIGRILALVIMLETGEVGRFAGVGNFASYCRCVEAKRVSNGKRKGGGNRKCGNAHLAWAFVEAANFSVRYDDRAKRFYQRKAAKSGRAVANKAVAIKAVAHKLARACFYVMRDEVPFDSERCFG